MSDVAVTNQASSVLHSAVTHEASISRVKNRPENTTGNIKLVSDHGKNAKMTIQFDATGQIVPSARNVEKHSATANFVDLLA